MTSQDFLETWVAVKLAGVRGEETYGKYCSFPGSAWKRVNHLGVGQGDFPTALLSSQSIALEF